MAYRVKIARRAEKDLAAIYVAMHYSPTRLSNGFWA
jgi:hypothetical protein